MKFRKIKFENHPILGNCYFDFTKENGKVVDTIIIAGENGCGKSVFLNELFNFVPYINKDANYKLTFEVELNDNETSIINQNRQVRTEFIDGIDTNIMTIIQDFSKKNTSVQINETRFNAYPILYVNQQNLFKCIYSNAEINFEPQVINSVTSQNIDQINTSKKSSSSLATEITQLLIDIKALDDSNVANWVAKHPDKIVPKEIQELRMKRFTNAFHTIFEHKRFKGIENHENHKVVNFEEFGKVMSIDQLSSGEKQIVFRGSFLLKDKKSIEGAYILIDEPEISLHPNWQLKILPFIKKLFSNEYGIQTSQIIIATHSPFIIHNSNRNDDKVIILKKNEYGQIEVEKEPKFYSWTPQQLVKEAFDLNSNFEPNQISVFVEGETDEKYYNKALDVFGYDKSKIVFKWIGRNIGKGKNENTGDTGLNNAAIFFKSNMQMAKSPIILLYDCDTNKSEENDRNLHIWKMNKNVENKEYKKGTENLLKLQDNFDYKTYYKEESKKDDYGAISKISKLDKTKLCDDICGLGNEELKVIFANLKSEIDKILSINSHERHII